MTETNFRSERPIYVNNCGYYIDIDNDISVNRPKGREDYHLLFPVSGTIIADGIEVGAGSTYLFYPSSAQHYKYLKEEGGEYYWLHFSGRDIPELMSRYGLCEGKIEVGNAKSTLAQITKMMTKALSEKYKYADDFVEGLLYSILSLISAPPNISSPFSRAIRILRDPQSNVTVEELAQMYNMTPNHFIRSFKKYVGASPNAFHISVRIDNACDMLTSTDMSIESIAHASGYEDPLYFSRAFKKQTGMSPTEYRKRVVL